MVNRKSIWILGQGGFLGSAIAKVADRSGFERFRHEPIPWDSRETRSESILGLAAGFAEFAHNGPSTIIWAAGTDGVADSYSFPESEQSAFVDLSRALRAQPTLLGSSLIICSSAGGVYGGAPNPPFSLRSPAVPINSYGRSKLAVEEIARNELSDAFDVHIARITNLYGPWAGSRQGLINRLCTAAATREALQIYVPLETSRDYINVDDAAQLLFLEESARDRPLGYENPKISLIGSGQSHSIGMILKCITEVTHRRVPVSFSEIEATARQPRDLRMVPSWMERNIDFSPITLPEGVKRLFDTLVTHKRWG